MEQIHGYSGGQQLPVLPPVGQGSWADRLVRLMGPGMRDKVVQDLFSSKVRQSSEWACIDPYADQEVVEAFDLLLGLAEKKGPSQEVSTTPDEVVEAVRAGDIRFLRRAYWAGVDLNRPNGEGEFPLHAVVKTKGVEVFEFLLEANCDPQVRNGNGELPCEVANSSTYHYALMGYGAGWQAWQLGEELRNAVERGTIDEVMEVLQNLQRAIPCQTWEDRQELCQKGSPINQYGPLGETALHIAARRGDRSILEELLNFVPSANIDVISVRGGNTPLHIAVETENWSCVQLLVAEGADLTVTDVHSRTLRNLIQLHCQENPALRGVGPSRNRRARVLVPRTPKKRRAPDDDTRPSRVARGDNDPLRPLADPSASDDRLA